MLLSLDQPHRWLTLGYSRANKGQWHHLQMAVAHRPAMNSWTYLCRTKHWFLVWIPPVSMMGLMVDLTSCCVQHSLRGPSSLRICRTENFQPDSTSNRSLYRMSLWWCLCKNWQALNIEKRFPIQRRVLISPCPLVHLQCEPCGSQVGGEGLE